MFSQPAATATSKQTLRVSLSTIVALSSETFSIGRSFQQVPNMSSPKKQRTAWIATELFGGSSQIWMRRQVSMLGGFDVHVLAHRLDSGFVDDGSMQIDIVDGHWPLPRTSRLRWSYKRLLGFINPVVASAEMSSAETRWWMRQIELQRPAVCLAQFGPMAIHLLPVMKAAGVPLIAHFHGHDATACLNQRGYRKRLRNLIHHFDRCVVVAEYQRQTLVDLGADARTIHVIPCGVPMPPETNRSNHPADQCRFLSVGRLVDKKRPDITVEAFCKIVDSGSVWLTIIGDGPLLKRCQAISRRRGCEERVRFLGACPPERVAEEMRSADVFVQHSVIGRDGDCEGWPVAIAEAASHGLPIVATRHASIPTQVIDGVTGMLVDEHDLVGMTEAMRTLAMMGQDRIAMGNHAREHIAKTSLEIQLSKLQTLMESIAKG